MLDALRRKRIAGAALDVFMQEPLPKEHPFWDLPGLVVSPHMCGDFIGWTAAVADLFVKNYMRWRRGEPLFNLVDKVLGYVASPDLPPVEAAGGRPAPTRLEPRRVIDG